MPDLASNMFEPIAGFPIKDKMMRYNIFVPRLYNFCKSLGFEPGRIMPSRSFCSDESQGYPIILLTKHFGTFPFNHGQVGGIVAIDRHGPHAEHGQDLVIIQASHVGYEPVSHAFGEYRRKQTEHFDSSPSCGKIHYVLDWYRNEYAFASSNIFIQREADNYFIKIDNQLLNDDRNEGLLLHHKKLVELNAEGIHVPVRTLSTSKVYRMSATLQKNMEQAGWRKEDGNIAIGKYLTPELFYFKRDRDDALVGEHQLERNLVKFMPVIVTASSPMLMAAQISTEIEFDRTYRSIVKEHSYQGKNLVFISGLNIDISPMEDNLFPLTKFVPWAAFIQGQDGSYQTMEQDELVNTLLAQSTDNPDQIDLEEVIAKMSNAAEVKIDL